MELLQQRRQEVANIVAYTQTPQFRKEVAKVYPNIIYQLSRGAHSYLGNAGKLVGKYCVTFGAQILTKRQGNYKKFGVIVGFIKEGVQYRAIMYTGNGIGSVDPSTAFNSFFQIPSRAITYELPFNRHVEIFNELKVIFAANNIGHTFPSPISKPDAYREIIGVYLAKKDGMDLVLCIKNESYGGARNLGVEGIPLKRGIRKSDFRKRWTNCINPYNSTNLKMVMTGDATMWLMLRMPAMSEKEQQLNVGYGGEFSIKDAICVTQRISILDFMKKYGYNANNVIDVNKIMEYNSSLPITEGTITGTGEKLSFKVSNYSSIRSGQQDLSATSFFDLRKKVLDNICSYGLKHTRFGKLDIITYDNVLYKALLQSLSSMPINDENKMQDILTAMPYDAGTQANTYMANTVKSISTKIQQNLQSAIKYILLKTLYPPYVIEYNGEIIPTVQAFAYQTSVVRYLVLNNENVSNVISTLNQQIDTFFEVALSTIEELGGIDKLSASDFDLLISLHFQDF